MQTQKGRADRKAKTAKPAEQECTYPINRHEKPDCADGNDGGGKIVPKQEKLFAKPVQQTVQGRLRIKEGAEERQREQNFPQPCAAVYNVADFLREHSEKGSGTNPDNKSKQHCSGNRAADTLVLLDSTCL